MSLGSGKDTGAEAGATVVGESRQQVGILFGFLALAAAAALARGVTGAHTTPARVVVGVLFGALLVIFVTRWIAMLRSPSRLEITRDAVSYVHRSGQVTSLSRQSGDELRFVQTYRGGRMWTLELTVVGAEPRIILQGFFSRRAVREACRARGWRFDDQVERQRGIRRSRG
jgi:hypothetical protein